MNETNHLNVRSWLSDGLVVAMVTALVYLATFIYESGYCANFGIPISLITPNLTTILAAGVALGAVLANALSTASVVRPILGIFKPPQGLLSRYFWGYAGIAFVLLCFLKALYDLSWRQFGLGILIFIALAVLLLLPTLFPDKGLSYVERTKKYLNGGYESYADIGSLLEKHLNLRMIGVVGGLSLFLIFAWMAGDGEARKKTQFLTVKGEDDTIILRNYGDLMIGAKFTRDKRLVSRELRLIWLGDKKRMDFLVENLGPLTLEPQKAGADMPASPPSGGSSAAASIKAPP